MDVIRYKQIGKNPRYPNIVMMYDPSTNEEYPTWLSDSLKVSKINDEGSNEYSIESNNGISKYYINTGGYVIVRNTDVIIGSDGVNGPMTMLGSINKEKFKLLYTEDISLIKRMVKWIKRVF